MTTSADTSGLEQLHIHEYMMKNVGFIQYGNNVKTGHKNNNNACVRDMQIEHPVNTLGQTVNKTIIIVPV
jgi:hypothetical protein